MSSIDITQDRPVPQANNLAALCTVVDSIADGCTTTTDIADAIGMSGRQGSYYPNAAADLGLVESVAGTSPVEWQLTAPGAAFVGMEAAARADALCEILLELDYLDVFTGSAQGPDVLRSQWAQIGLGPETIDRRLATISSWATFAMSDSDDQAASIASAMTGTRQRTPGVRAAAQARRGAKAAKIPRRICPSCQMTIALALSSCDRCE